MSKKGEAAETLWNTLTDEQKQDVKAVATDMWPAFMTSAAEHVPDADIVHDRFHISKHLGEAVDKVRRSEHKSLKADGDDRLTGSRYLRLTNEENLPDKQADSFESLKEAQLKTSRAWAIRELFRDFVEYSLAFDWDQPGPYTGRLFFKK